MLGSLNPITGGCDRPSWNPKCSWPASAPGLTLPSTWVTVLKVPRRIVSSSSRRSDIVCLQSPVIRIQPWIVCLKAGSQAGSVVSPVTVPGSPRPPRSNEADASASWPLVKNSSLRSSVMSSWNKIACQTGLRKVQEALIIPQSGQHAKMRCLFRHI